MTLVFARFFSSHTSFWQSHPALLSAMSLLIGTSALLFCGHFYWVIFWGLYLLICKKSPQIILLSAAVLFGWVHILPTDFPKETQAIFSPHSLQPYQSPFRKSLMYKGTLSLREGSVPCTIYYHGKQSERPFANQKYIVSGKLERQGDTNFTLRAKKWSPFGKSWSLGEIRYKSKERFRKYLSSKLISRNAGFLSSLTTGDVEDRLLRYEFSRLGLQHVLAISGFHFGALLAFSAFILGLFLPKRWKIWALMISISAYFLFVGSSPSVQRSWLVSLFYLMGSLLGRPTNGLNLLGCALTIELMLDPHSSANIGFQLSFLSCGAILMFYPLFDQSLQRFFPKRGSNDLEALDSVSKHGYLLSSFFRASISITLAVNLVLLPILLHHFHEFPLLSLLYNLFVPFLVTIDLFLLLLSLLFSILFPPISNLLFSMTDFFTTQILELVSYPPLALDYSIQAQNIPSWMICLYLFGIFFCYLYKKHFTNELFQIS